MTIPDFKPHLACDADLSKIKFPVIVMPKIDGVRALNIDGQIVGRSKKSFANSYIGEVFSQPHLAGFDGELVLGNPIAPDLCSATTGFVNRKTAKDGKPTESDELAWMIFDYITPDTITLPYQERLRIAANVLMALQVYSCPGANRASIVRFDIARNIEELLALEEQMLDVGYEGIILRDPEGLHKSGRSTVKSGAYLRVKRFIDFEGIIEELVEATENRNEAKINELGYTERSTHQANMVPKGMVGTIRMRSLADVVEGDKVLIAKGQLVDVGPGNMPHKERIEAWKAYEAGTEDNIIGKIGKAKFFPKGHKDKPRFPTFIGVRSEVDMS